MVWFYVVKTRSYRDCPDNIQILDGPFVKESRAVVAWENFVHSYRNAENTEIDDDTHQAIVNEGQNGCVSIQVAAQTTRTGHIQSSERVSGHVVVHTKCPFCHSLHVVMTPEAGFDRFIAGEHVQNALPGLSSNDRELLLSGVCPKCWGELYPEGEEEEAEEEDV